MKLTFLQWLDAVTTDETKQKVQVSLRECDASTKELVKRTPTKWLGFHLETAVRDEHYELADYIKKEIEKRNETDQ